MEQLKDINGLLNLIEAPAFCVKGGAVVLLNEAARNCGIAEGVQISDLLNTGKREYEEYNGGCLYLDLKMGGASVNRVEDYDIFRLEDTEDQAQLQAMALASQDLRQPLTNVMTIADQLFPLTGEDASPALQEHIARINRGLYQMQRIIVNMSDAFRYNKETVGKRETIDICSYINEQFTAAGELIGHTGMTLDYTPLSESIFCLADAEKLERAIHNILSNSLKFAPKNSTIQAKLARKGNMLYLTVADSGSGISPSLRQNVFSRYRRQPGVEDGRYGIGLGMVLIRNAATVHGGTVLLEQSESIGNRLTMTLVIDQHPAKGLHSPILKVDYAGGRDHRLLELSDSLPSELYKKENIN